MSDHHPRKLDWRVVARPGPGAYGDVFSWRERRKVVASLHYLKGGQRASDIEDLFSPRELAELLRSSSLRRERLVESPPGWKVRGWAARLVGSRLYEKVFEGQFGEFELEHREALAAGDVAEAERIVWRYRVQLVITMVGLVPTSLARLIFTLWKLGG